MKSKHAVSSIIATTSIILISLVVVGILGGIIFKVLNKPQLAPGSSCIDLQISPPLSILDSCYRVSTGDLEVRIARDSTELLTETVVFESTIDSQRRNWQCGAACGTACILQEKGTVKTYYLTASAPNVSISIPQMNLYLGSCNLQTRPVRLC